MYIVSHPRSLLYAHANANADANANANANACVNANANVNARLLLLACGQTDRMLLLVSSPGTRRFAQTDDGGVDIACPLASTNRFFARLCVCR